MTLKHIAIDFGMSNVKVAVAQPRGLPVLRSLPRMGNASLGEVRRVLQVMEIATHDVEVLCVTGGQAHLLPDQFEQARVIKVNEVDAIGRGGLHLAKLDEALIVSAGSGTAMIAARKGGADCKHITGSAVGGGTLQGLARLLIGTTHPQEINALAEQGDSNQVDLTLLEATGGVIGTLPVDANAVNFGKLAHVETRGFSGGSGVSGRPSHCRYRYQRCPRRKDKSHRRHRPSGRSAQRVQSAKNSCRLLRCSNSNCPHPGLWHRSGRIPSPFNDD